MSVRIAKPQHEVLYQELCALVNRHAHEMTAEEILAVAANMLGKLMALQDQRTMTSQRAMETVIRNIEMGNKQAIDELGKTKGTA